MYVKEKYTQLLNWFKSNDKYAIAFSGGVDSCLVLYAARQALGKNNVLAIISDSPSLKRKDLVIARDFCRQYDIKLVEIDAGEIHDENYTSNPINRCYFCKSALYGSIEKLLSEKFTDYNVLNGSNVSDFGDFRPGLNAASEHKVYSPLADCKFTKDDIRELSKYLELPTWNKPASPCLSSRFPYGENITVEKLNKVEQAETIIEELGIENSRVRYIEGKARIEVDKNKIAELEQYTNVLNESFRKIGFSSLEIDKEGFKSGKLNGKLSTETIQEQLKAQNS